MKKILLACLIGILPTFLMAQHVAMNDKIKNNTDFSTAVAATVDGTAGNAKTAKEIRKAERETKLFTKTTKAFSHDFENASNVKWSSANDGYTALFTKDNIKNVAWYSKGGYLRNLMLTYNADKLPNREQEVIRNEYKGYKITSVEEVHQDDIVVYVVHLEDDSHIKLVTVCDGATNIYRTYKKM